MSQLQPQWIVIQISSNGAWEPADLNVVWKSDKRWLFSEAEAWMIHKYYSRRARKKGWWRLHYDVRQVYVQEGGQVLLPAEEFLGMDPIFFPRCSD